YLPMKSSPGVDVKSGIGEFHKRVECFYMF
ncbi:MAG: hypothetical protein ACI9XB_002456, partial [Gammaproteobacteria bacterium]